ncbi:hypothetical protein ACFWHR_07505 [Leucobacter sp. NPDC058333]|uniref:hypothetical protein n=1 Tax=Leucobacter sp. NPDC058333 TaxID=3346450 RepID=UPI003651B04C
MSSRKRAPGAFGCLAIVLLILLAGSIGITKSLHRVEHTSCVVEEKDRAASEHGSDMRVYTSCGIFAVADSIWLLRWNSADVYQQIEVGKTYDLETSGWRVPLLSWFPNIVKAEAV